MSASERGPRDPFNENEPTLTIGFRRPQVLVGLAVMTMLAGAGLFATLKTIPIAPSSRGLAIGLAAYTILGVFTPGLLGIVWCLRRWRRPALTLDARGLTDLTPILGPPLRLEWEQIAQVIIASPRVLWKQIPRALYIVPRDPDAIRASRPFLLRRRLGLSWRVLGFRAVVFVGEDVEIDLSELAAHIARMANIEVEDRTTATTPT